MAKTTEALINAGENQTVEFKESLSSGRKKEAIETLVAFANGSGGSVLFGVTDDGQVVGANVGADTQEKLAELIRRRTYPSLPVEITVTSIEGAVVLRVDTPADRPPLIGVYCSSTENLNDTDVVDTANLSAFRRVGATNRRTNFMLLREPRRAEPDVVLRRGTGMTRGAQVPKSWGYVYSNAGDAWAFDVRIFAIHPTLKLSYVGPKDLEPNSDSDSAQLACSNPEEWDGTPVVLAAEYSDPNGLKWRSSLTLTPAGSEGYVSGARDRLIYEFPPMAHLTNRG